LEEILHIYSRLEKRKEPADDLKKKHIVSFVFDSFVVKK
jgi:hypothetical protein